MVKFSTFGQMNLDLLFGGVNQLPKTGEEVFAKAFDVQLGGGPMVCPIILQRLGIESKLGTFLSNDMISSISERMMLAKKFTNYENFNRDHPSPVVVTSVMSLKDDRSFVCYNEHVREKDLDDEVVYNFLKKSKVIFAPTGKLEVLKRLHQEKVQIIYDTGWVENIDISMFEETLKYVDIFTPNDKEAMAMTKTTSVKEAVKVLAMYVKHPIVSCGEKGCITYLNNEWIEVPMPKSFKVVDTTGAGDNFLTGIAYGLIHDQDIITCMQYGNVFGGYSTEALGCFKADINLEVIEELMSLYSA